MRSNTRVKVVKGTAPVDANGAGASLTAAIDTLGFNSMLVITMFGVVSTADFTAFLLTECDTSGGTYTTVTGTELAGADLPTAAGADGDINLTFVNLGGARKRYFKVGYTPPAGVSLISICFVLFDGDIDPVTATQHGATWLQQVVA